MIRRVASIISCGIYLVPQNLRELTDKNKINLVSGFRIFAKVVKRFLTASGRRAGYLFRIA